VLSGPNGSGKSSLLRVIAGLLRPTAGYVKWGDVEVHKAEGYKAAMHYIGHFSAVKSVLTVYENVRFWSDINGGAEIETALDSFGLKDIEDSPGRVLSAGQKRRVALANLVAVPRKVWLLDEVSAGLDGQSVQALRSAINLHRDKGGLIVAATHGELDLSDVKKISLGGVQQ
jgi:heme exporter protein A